MKKFISMFLVVATMASTLPIATAFAKDTNNNNTKASKQISVVAETEATTEATEPTDSTPTTAPTTAPVVTKPTTQPTTAPVIKKVTPAKVKGFKIAKKTTSAIKLTWKKNTKNTTNYVIYRSYEKSRGKCTDYKLYKTLSKKTTSYTDKGLKSGFVYKYRIYAYNKTKTYVTHSAGVAVKTMVQMKAPKTFKVNAATSSYIKLAWSKVTNAGQYCIFRKTSGTKYTRIGKTTSTAYTDKKVVAGTKYKYQVRAYRTTGGKTYASPAKAVVALAGVKSVGGITAKSYLGRALLTWSTVAGASGYDVYAINAKGKYIYKTTRYYGTYLSGKCKVGKTYTFAVKSFKKVGNVKSYGTTKKVSVTIVGTAYGNKPSGTWVEVCIETQQMYMYVNNKLYCTTPVVTGNDSAGRRTTPGYHRVISKKSPAVLHGSFGGSSWNTRVSYWLGFTGDGQGIHDSTWRTSGYGGQIYKGNGSHGCVNTPYSAVAKIFSKAYVGMPVIVY